MIANSSVMDSRIGVDSTIEADARYDLRVGEEANIEIGYTGDGELSIDPATPLPAGLVFENNTISGVPTVDCDVKINILSTNNNGVRGKVVRLVILPQNGEAGDMSPVEPNKKKGCFGEVGAVVLMTSVVGLALAGLLCVKALRKKEE